jgi:Tol biopolymer transport system component
MTDDQLELRLRDWFRAEIPADETAPAALRSVVMAVPNVRPASARLVSGRGLALVAAATLLAIAAGAFVVGGPPSPAPGPTEQPTSAPPSATVEPSSVAPGGRIVYARETRLRNGEGDCTTSAAFCHRRSVFIANSDGSDERLLVPGTSSSLAAVSRDGSNVLVSMLDPDGEHLYLTNVDGSAPRRFDTLCDTPCFEDYAFVFSPDGARLAFLRSHTDETQFLAVMDLATGAVEELHATDGIAGPASWSPDGRQLAFKRYLIDADGTNLREIAPAELYTGLFDEAATGYSAPQFSPDGSLIAFASFNDTFPTNSSERNSQRLMDIYVVRSDGSDLRRLTTETVAPLGTSEAGDFGAAFPTWTREGRITYTSFPVPPDTETELWVMDPDGTNSAQLDSSDPAALTAIGCVSCTYPALKELRVPNFAYWVPGP